MVAKANGYGGCRHPDFHRHKKKLNENAKFCPNDKKDEGFNNTMVKFLIGNARSLGADTKIEVTATLALMEEDDVLIFWETGMRDTNVLEIPGYRRIVHAGKPGLGQPTFGGVGMWIK